MSTRIYLRRGLSVLFVLGFCAILVVMGKPVGAIPLSAADTSTATETETPTSTNVLLVNTLTPTGTATLTQTVVSTPTPTATLTPTAPLYLTRTPTPSRTKTPTSTSFPIRAVIINEVAWMGTLANANSEWIELYNPGRTSISLEGWKLSSKYNELDVALHGEIKADGYYLIARKSWITDTTGPFSDITPDLLYYVGRPLSDSGDYLVLLDSYGNTIDTANSMNGMWPAGISTYDRKCSMERGGDKLLDKFGSWLTNIGGVAGNGHDIYSNAICGTPGKKNWAESFKPTATATSQVYPARTVIINEVAWMGTLANDGSEWIELHNPGKTSISLEGWKLRSKYKELDVALHGEIKAGEYYLLARKSSISDTTVPFSDITISSDRFYVSSRQLSDSGDYLVLLDPKGKTIDTANSMNGKWPAGYSSYDRKCSMERGGDKLLDKWGSWLTNIGGVAGNGHDMYGNQICGTPGQRNWADGIKPTATYTPTRTITPYVPYRTPTRTPTPKRSPTPTFNPNATPPVVVIINEFLVQPRFDWNGDGEVNTGDEFIEIINLGRRSALLTGWSLDDQAGDSNPYRLDDITIEPLGHKTFFSSTTGILLSTGGDSLRLFKSTGQIADAYTYGFNPIADQSWCRLPDGTGTWRFGCEPSVDLANRKAQSAIQGVRVIPAICLLQSLPIGILQAECDQPGLSFWNVDIWSQEPTFPRFIEDGEYFYILD
jgi:hypothetical protein